MSLKSNLQLFIDKSALFVNGRKQYEVCFKTEVTINLTVER